MALSFKKQVQQKSYQHVVEQIQEAMLNGELIQGDRLPSELKLKDMFETSRGTIREALRVLEQKGLVVVKTGVKGGATIQKAGTKPISESIGLLIRHQEVSLQDLAQFRVLLEGFVTYQAAIYAQLDDLDALKSILARARTHIDTGPSGWEAFNQLDAQFHQKLAKIAGNPLIEANLKTLHENIHIYFRKYLPFSDLLLKEDYADLGRILESIKQKNPDEAQKRARDHVQLFSTFMETQMLLNKRN
ncbi:MAG: FCD domain-containing protein [Desulfobacula sp.]|nr:FCD domain-containing protein [Desulfobacula sp.]